MKRYKPLLIFEEFDQTKYLKWKKQNVTFRGMKSVSEDNNVYDSWGKGLYTVPLSNKAMAKELLNQGHDGFIIKGREIVNYKPEKILLKK